MSPTAVGQRQRQRHRLSKAISKFSIGRQPDSDSKSDSDPFAFVSIVTVVTLAAGQDFGYRGQHGPEHWKEDFKRCSGKYQSPINIDEHNVEKRDFPEIEYINFNVTPESLTMTNNGHTVLVNMKFPKGMEPRMRGGPLASKADYQFEQFHFHWGENDTVGSEDLINNQAYPAEMHVVMRSLDYPDFQSALDKDHGIAVLAYFFKVTKSGNSFQICIYLLCFYRSGTLVVPAMGNLPGYCPI